MTGNGQVDNGSLKIMALESGIEYPDFSSAPDEPLLVRLIGFSPSQLAYLSQRFEIDLEDLQDMQDPDERPRLQVEDKFTMLVLRVPFNLEVEVREYSTRPVGIFTNGRDIVLVQTDEIPLRKQRLKRKIPRATTPQQIIYSMWEITIHSFETTLDIIEATINDTEKTIKRELYPSQMDRFFQLSRDAVFMEAALRANMRVLRRLKRVPRIGRMLLDVERLEELEVDLQQQLELSRIYRDLIENAMNAYDMFVNHNLNRVIKTLTSISLLVMVPTLIASIYGMNIELPIMHNELAFPMIMLASFLITLPFLVYLRMKNLV